MSFGDFFRQLESCAEDGANRQLVLSDERSISKAELVESSQRDGNEWRGVPLDEIPDEDLTARLDIPVREMSVVVYEDQVLMIVSV